MVEKGSENNKFVLRAKKLQMKRTKRHHVAIYISRLEMKTTLMKSVISSLVHIDQELENFVLAFLLIFNQIQRQ